MKGLYRSGPRRPARTPAAPGHDADCGRGGPGGSELRAVAGFKLPVPVGHGESHESETVNSESAAGGGGLGRLPQPRLPVTRSNFNIWNLGSCYHSIACTGGRASRKRESEGENERGCGGGEKHEGK